jgi:carbonic anhydrase
MPGTQSPPNESPPDPSRPDESPADDQRPPDPRSHDLTSAIAAFQRDKAPLVRDELARLAREGQRPTRLFLACADSRLVTSMITASRPGDAFTVRNVGNLVPLPPPPGTEPAACDSVAAAIEYAVDVLRVGSITVCGHSGCGAMQALLAARPPASAHAPPTALPERPSPPGRNASATSAPQTSATRAPHAPGEPAPGAGSPAGPPTPLARWLRHGTPSLTRLADPYEPLSERPVEDEVEQLCLLNVVQQLDHLMAHPCVARGVAAGELRLQGMYFHMAEAQGYLLDEVSGRFRAVRPRSGPSLRAGKRPGQGRPAAAPGRWG